MSDDYDDYTELAAEFLRNMAELRKAGLQRSFTDSLRGESFILQFLARHDGLVLPGAISHEMNISSARITAILNSLENKGLLTREIDPGDRRRILIRLTAAGKDKARQCRQAHLDETVSMLRLLEKDDAGEYVRLTGLLAHRLCQSNPTR